MTRSSHFHAAFLTGALLLTSAGSALAADSNANVLVRLEKALARETGERGNVQMFGAVPAVGGSTEIRDIEFDYRSRRFSANLISGDETRQVSGRFVAVQRMPVPRQRIAAGREIESDDIEWVNVDQNKVTGDMVAQIDEVVGMAAKRDLVPGQPFRARDLTKAMLVTKGALVTVVYKTPFMTLTAVGRAVDAGSRGDVVAIMNLQSKKTLFATVTGTNTAAITLGQPAAATN